MFNKRWAIINSHYSKNEINYVLNYFFLETIEKNSITYSLNLKNDKRVGYKTN